MVLHNAYGNSPRRAYASLIDDLGDAGTTVKVALLESGYTPDMSAHETFDDVSTSEVAATGEYVAGGEEVTTKTLAESAGTTTFDGDDVVWSNSTITASYAVVYVDTGTASTSSLLTLVDFEGSQSSDNGDFTVSWDAAGIFEITT